MKLAGYPTARSDAPFSSPETFGQEFGATDTKVPAQLCETGWPSSAERELAESSDTRARGARAPELMFEENKTFYLAPRCVEALLGL